MTPRRSDFKFIDRGYKDTLLLIPGWGLDHRTFAALDVKYNYLVSTFVWPGDFLERLEETLQKLALKQISILGHSMGGFLAVDFAVKYTDKITELILIGVRKRYGAQDIEPTRGNIRKSRAGFMYKMYDMSFSTGEKDILSYFKSTLLKTYIKEMDGAILEAGLDYLSKAEIKAEDLKGINVRFIHGYADVIAPISETEALASELPAAKFKKVKGGGHMLLLRKDFNSIFCGD